jgi:hypothetical protein
MLRKSMKKITFITLIFSSFFLSACVNKHGVSLKYYSDCKEYYDLQGYYHKDCGEDDIVTYKGVSDSVVNTVKKFTQSNEQKNVW